MEKKFSIKTLFKNLRILLTFGLITYIILFIVYYFDLDGKLLFHFVEPTLVKHYDAMERRNPLEVPYAMTDREILEKGAGQS